MVHYLTIYINYIYNIIYIHIYTHMIVTGNNIYIYIVTSDNQTQTDHARDMVRNYCAEI